MRLFECDSVREVHWSGTIGGSFRQGACKRGRTNVSLNRVPSAVNVHLPPFAADFVLLADTPPSHHLSPLLSRSSQTLSLTLTLSLLSHTLSLLTLIPLSLAPSLIPHRSYAACRSNDYSSQAGRLDVEDLEQRLQKAITLGEASCKGAKAGPWRQISNSQII